MSATRTLIASRGRDAGAWGRRDVALRDPGGEVVFRADGVEAPSARSDLAVVIVASRWMLGAPGAERSVRDMVRRVVEAIGGWALKSGQAASAGARRALEDALARLIV